MQRAFICYNSKYSKLIIEICRYLKPNLDDIFFFEESQKNDNSKSFISIIGKKISDFEIFIAFIGEEVTDWQKDEIEALIDLQNDKQSKKSKKNVIPVLLNIPELPSDLMLLRRYERCMVDAEKDAFKIAKEIISKTGLTWKSKDGLPPISNNFYYEKNIIKDYINLLELNDKIYTESGTNSKEEELKKNLREKLIYGLPPVWPKVKKMPVSEGYHDNTVYEIGKFRPENAKVVAAALTSFHPNSGACIYKDQLTFPEAGPREKLFFPRPGRNLRVAILVSGGIAPGINAVINGITQRHELYSKKCSKPYKVEIYGLQNGFYAFDDYYRNRKLLDAVYTSSVANESGSCIGTSRDDRLLEVSSIQDQNEKIIEQLFFDDIELLYIIGGDGSMKAAHSLWNYSKEMIKEPRYRGKKLSIIGIPKTMDNDILWVWQTFGFLSAVEKAREIIEQLSAEVISNPRICIVQLFGSDSGFVVSHAVVASKSNVCDAALIPEVPFTMKSLSDYLRDKIESESQRINTRIPMSLIVMAETAIPTDALDFIDDPMLGLTDDEKNVIRNFIEKKQLVSINKRNDLLRTAGLKIVSRVLRQLLPQSDNANIAWSRLRVFTNEPRHILRAISPSCSDTIMGNRLGCLFRTN